MFYRRSDGNVFKKIQMSLKKFTMILILGKPLSIAIYSFLLLLGGHWLDFLIK